jgi:CRP-like cAMP-binding protein
MLKRGTVAQRVYFIVKGRVLNVQTQRIYSDGALIGETDIIYKKRRTETFVALDDIVHVLRLDARILRDMMDIFPDIKKDLVDMAKEREIARLRSDP